MQRSETRGTGNENADRRRDGLQRHLKLNHTPIAHRERQDEGKKDGQAEQDTHESLRLLHDFFFHGITEG